MSKEALKAKVFAAIDNNAEKIIGIGEQIWKNPEPGYREFKTAKLAAEILKSLDLPTREGLGITGIRADLEFGKPGPTIAMLGELDSLVLPTHPECDPATGAVHACGHNASMAGMLGAAIGLVSAGISNELSGKIAFVAVPAEECIEIEKRLQMIAEKKISSLGGKGELIRQGVFDDVQLAFMLHAGGRYGYGAHNGFISKKVVFKGHACHAAAPGNGISALHAMTLAQSAVGLLRERWAGMNHTVRIHGIVTQGGDVVNIIPDQCKMEFLLRADKIDTLKILHTEFDRAMQGAAMAIGAGVDIETIPGYMPQYDDCELERIYSETAAALDPEITNRGSNFSCASTDMGDLSTVMPTLHAYTAGAAGTGHGITYHIADKQRAYVVNAKILAGIAIELMADGAK
ncbi:MAG: amidohydrolase, partial [Lentisphaeria bacterium]|nr:amidohydrolase [Lentisphaeria bacterium]